MRLFSILFICLFGIISSFAQEPEDDIEAVIYQFFDGMKNADTLAMKSNLTDHTIFQSVDNSKETTKVSDADIGLFLRAVSASMKGDLDERIEILSVLQDGEMAHVWVPYEFYYKGRFSHRGVNQFVLIRYDQEWKIQYLIDTRRK